MLLTFDLKKVNINHREKLHNSGFAEGHQLMSLYFFMEYYVLNYRHLKNRKWRWSEMQDYN